MIPGVVAAGAAIVLVACTTAPARDSTTAKKAPEGAAGSETGEKTRLPMKLNVGDKAPEFSLPGNDGREHRLADQKGKWTLLYFYPKDDTPGCTKEACTIRDNYPDFTRLGVDVLGVSTDSIASHDKFAKKHALPFTLLADERKKVVEAYGVGSKVLGIPLPFPSRTSFLIDPDLKIAKIYEKVDPGAHAKEVLEDLRGLLRERGAGAQQNL